MICLDTKAVSKCDIGIDTCDVNAICTDAGSSYTCDCSEGYSGDGYYCIKDVNECDEGTHTCDVNAFCTDTTSSYTCACNDGYSGDGLSCNGKIK